MDTSPYTNPLALAMDSAYLPTPQPTTETAPPAPEKPPEEPAPVVLPAATKTERFFLTAADQSSGTRNERLNMVIRSKYEAGLLKPYNYVKGYARLSRWMDKKCVRFPSCACMRLVDLSPTQRVPGVEAEDSPAVINIAAQIPSALPCLSSAVPSFTSFRLQAIAQSESLTDIVSPNTTVGVS